MRLSWFRPRSPRSPRTLDRLRVAAATAGVVTAFAIVGAAAGPSWDPDLVTTSIDPEVDSVSVLASTPETVLGRYETTSQLVDVEVDDGVTVQVLVVAPIDAPGTLPAVVFLHGAGTGLAEAFAEHAQAFASAGVVAVAPSKRLDTYSTTHRDYPAMAQDYAHTVALARSLPQVDPERVGLYSESEGTWVAPVLATEDPSIAFVAMVSAPVVPPREQAAFAVDAYLRAVGVPSALLRAIPRATGAQLPGGILAYADFDVRPYLREMAQPVLMTYGTADRSMPTVQGPQIVIGAVPRGPEQVMVRYYEGANHGIRIGSGTDPVVPDFLAGVAAWMLDPVAAQEAGPWIAGATPEQVHVASAVPQPRWYADGEMLLRVPLIAFLVAVGGYVVLLGVGVVAFVRRHWGRGEGWGGGLHDGAPLDGVILDGEAAPTRLARRLLGLSAATALVLVALVAYIVGVAQVALSYSTAGFGVWGGWALVQLLAILAALSLVLAARALIRVTRQRRATKQVGLLAGEDGTGLLGVRTTRVLAGARLVGGYAVVLGSGGLLFVAAYWGAFSPIS